MCQGRLAQCYLAAPAFGFQGPVPPGRCASDKTKRPAGLAGGGGLVSTARDYAKFARFLQTGRAADSTATLLSPRALTEMRTNALPGDISGSAFEKGAVGHTTAFFI